MFLIHGHYNFGRRKAVCKNEYCTYCRQAALVEGYRSFAVLHLFWIPLVPLWFRTEWRCTRCGKDPYGKRPMSRFLATAGLFCGLIGLAAMMATFTVDESDRDARWLMIGLFGLLTGGMLYNLWCAKRRTEYLANRKAVIPLSKEVCPYCQQALFARHTTRCDNCKIRIE